LFLRNGTFLLKMLPANNPMAIIQNCSNHCHVLSEAKDTRTSCPADASHNVIKIFITTRFF
ncbi:MAG: hypothetical protein IKM23_05105, partial [Bacteroidales bacterium]|nr:hypothetical protein [Bacteroidales bacterium]